MRLPHLLVRRVWSDLQQTLTHRSPSPSKTPRDQMAIIHSIPSHPIPPRPLLPSSLPSYHVPCVRCSKWSCVELSYERRMGRAPAGVCQGARGTKTPNQRYPAHTCIQASGVRHLEMFESKKRQHDSKKTRHASTQPPPPASAAAVGTTMHTAPTRVPNLS